MSIRRKRISIALFMVFVMITATFPWKAHGEVQPITDLEDKLENITDEEKAVLEDLFKLSQDIAGLEKKETDINNEIDNLQFKINDLEKGIKAKQKAYDIQLEVLKQVLVNYQRGGPATYLEILLSADNFSEFLKSLNIIKDISHNVNELLASLKEDKQLLQEQKDQLASNEERLKQSKVELAVNLKDKQKLQENQQAYLESLLTDKEFYQGQLDNLTQLWGECRTLFPSISTEITNIIDAGYFSLEDLNLDTGFFTISGFIEEGTFNQILMEHSTLPQTIFKIENNQVVIKVPDEHLILKGNFIITGDTAIQYEVKEGSYYDIPLNEVSIEELFQNGPLLLDFGAITGDLISINFKLKELWSSEGALNFVILPQF